MTPTHKSMKFLLYSLIVVGSLCVMIAITLAVVGSSRPSPEEQKRQDFVDGCKYYSNGAPDTSTKPWRCIK